ncbi:esterase/lipase [Diaporthe sp. PMI_573]|nr:esterase/lipase [Diaporthaceae sp. PMI_573]
MTSHPPGSCCYKGVKHDGDAVGRLEGYDDLEVYISEPKNGSSDKGILILTDVVGHKFINAQLLADQFAANGYFVMMPDLFHGDPVPLNHPEEFDIMAWINGACNKNKIAHLPGSIDPVVEKSLSVMRSKYGCKRIGAVGYCFGAKYVVRFLDDKKLNAGFTAHPSFVEKAELEAIKAPLTIAAAENDFMFPPDKRKESEEVLGKLDVPAQINLYLGAEHGFAVRCDLAVKRQKLAKEAAFLQAVLWFDTHL